VKPRDHLCYHETEIIPAYWSYEQKNYSHIPYILNSTRKRNLKHKTQSKESTSPDCITIYKCAFVSYTLPLHRTHETADIISPNRGPKLRRCWFSKPGILIHKTCSKHHAITTTEKIKHWDAEDKASCKYYNLSNIRWYFWLKNRHHHT
jgi:hypothetical protein